MSDVGDARLSRLVLALADAVSFVVFEPLGRALLAAALGGAFLLSVWNGVRERSLACAAAGKKLKPAEATFVLGRELVSTLGKVFTFGPVLIALAIGGAALVGFAETIRKFEDFEANQRRIQELRTVVRNLDRRARVAGVEALSYGDGKTRIRLTFYAGGTDRVAGTQELELPGRDIYVDSVVCNFDYSEIEAGRRVNLALPYRVFSEEVAQDRGVPLDLYDAKGVPFAYRRDGGDVYGLEPDAYDRRLEELSALLRDNDASRKAGIVRSLYGSALHRVMKPGDSVTIWAEQSGGLVMKDRGGF